MLCLVDSDAFAVDMDRAQSSPYIHVGCDETGTPPTLPGYGAFASKHNISDGSDLFAYYVKTMADAVKKTGKQAMIWGPAQMKRLEPGDAVVRLSQKMTFVTATGTDANEWRDFAACLLFPCHVWLIVSR